MLAAITFAITAVATVTGSCRPPFSVSTVARCNPASKKARTAPAILGCTSTRPSGQARLLVSPPRRRQKFLQRNPFG